MSDDQHLIFDFFLGLLEKFAWEHHAEIVSLRHEARVEVFQPVKHLAGRRLTKSQAKELLTGPCADAALRRLREICARHSIDFWMSILRRFPREVYGTEGNWIIYCTLAVIKYSDWGSDTTLGQVNSERQFGVALAVTEDDLFDCFRIANFSFWLDYSVGLNRWAGKGAVVRVDADGFPQLEADAAVLEAVRHYERRRPENGLSQDQGLHVKAPLESAAGNIILMNRLQSPIPLTFPKNNFTLFLRNYFPHPTATGSLTSGLRAYEEALTDSLGAGSEAILGTLRSLSSRVWQTTPALKAGDGTAVCDLDVEGDAEAHHKVQFFFDLSQKGYIRMPEAVLRERLSDKDGFPEGFPAQQASRLVNTFFDSFLLTEETRDSIDVLALEPCPLIYTSPGGNCYFDLLLTADFLNWVFAKGREWFSTQHGDRFTLSLKRLVEQSGSGAEVVGAKKMLQTDDGRKAEADLLVRKGETLYAVECKAYSKSREYWLGNYDAVTARDGRISAAVRQARDTAGIIAEIIQGRGVETFGCTRVEWVLCLPAQEFLKPLEKYEMLTAEIPRVCTPEEFVTYLSGA